MVFADREETISGGNFHGEYPAKVKVVLSQSLENFPPNPLSIHKMDHRLLLSGFTCGELGTSF